MSYIRLAEKEGGRILCGGEPPASVDPRCKDGIFLQPTVIVDLDASCRVNQEEIFGPVVTITPFQHEEEVIAWANGTPFGLSASLWTRDLSRAHRVAEQIESGTVWVNCWLLRDLRTPFGGMKTQRHWPRGRRGSAALLHRAENGVHQVCERSVRKGAITASASARRYNARTSAGGRANVQA